MVGEVLSTQRFPIASEDDVLVVRRRVRELADQAKFDTFAVAAIITATSELGRNVLVHGKGGEVTIEEIAAGARKGLRLAFVDTGPGIPDIPRVLAGGYSTAKSMGLGLSGSKRLVDEFELVSTVGRGTRVTVTKWKRF